MSTASVVDPYSGLIGFDSVRRVGGSVSVQARDHR